MMKVKGLLFKNENIEGLQELEYSPFNFQKLLSHRLLFHPQS